MNLETAVNLPVSGHQSNVTSLPISFRGIREEMKTYFYYVIKIIS